jgi:LPXTG-site transpeptidase (sortase) family protein
MLVASTLTFGAVFVHATLYSASPLDGIGGTSKADASPAFGDSSELPATLIIPKLGINASVQRVGIAKSGRMAVPTNFTDVAWYEGGTVPGNKGSAVIAGHLDNGLGLRGVFSDLANLSPGDRVEVRTSNGRTLTFKVDSLKIYPYESVPSTIFTANDAAHLNLITCEGDGIRTGSEGFTYDHRLVVYTTLVSQG